MNRLKNELKQFKDEIIWLDNETASDTYAKVISCCSKKFYGLKPDKCANIEKIDLDNLTLEEANSWLELKLAKSNDSLFIVYGKNEVFKVSTSFFLETWNDIFCPSRDDVLITTAVFNWILYYIHEDEFEYGDCIKPELTNMPIPQSTILNQQNYLDVETKDFLHFIDNSLNQLDLRKYLSIAFVENKKIKSLNNQFRSKNNVTDVLSFLNEDDEFENDVNYLGDIVISIQQANRQAIENNLPLEIEIKQLILHGILHLCGYDHETDNGEMNELELEIREQLNIGG